MRLAGSGALELIGLETKTFAFYLGVALVSISQMILCNFATALA
jgi:hypothetical protein